MSGPKILSPEEIKMRQEAEERYRLIQDQYRLCEALRRQIASCDDIRFLLFPIRSDLTAKKLDEQASAIIQRANQELQACDHPESTDNAYYRRRVNVLQRLVDENQRLTQDIKSKAEKIKKQHVDEMLSHINESAAAARKEVSQSNIYIRQDIPAEFLKAEASRLQQLVKRTGERAARIGYPVSDELEEIISSFRASVGDRNRKLYMIYDELHRIDLFQLQPLLSRVERAEADYDRLDSLLSAELATYHALCHEHNISPQKFSFAESSIREIRYASAAILREHDAVVNYGDTMRRIRAVLSQMGYSYLGEKEEDRRVYRQIFRIHDRTILHVIYDSTGRVTMEVAIEDNCDREPLTREVESLVTEQGVFCNSFENILREMSQNGLHMQKEMMFPVSADFAQIINTSGFRKEPEEDMSIDYSVFSTPATKYKEMS